MSEGGGDGLSFVIGGHRGVRSRDTSPDLGPWYEIGRTELGAKVVELLNAK